MKRLVLALIVGAVLTGVVGVASAENGPIIPWSKVRVTNQKPIWVTGENGTILPW